MTMYRGAPTRISPARRSVAPIVKEKEAVPAQPIPFVDLATLVKMFEELKQMHADVLKKADDTGTSSAELKEAHKEVLDKMNEIHASFESLKRGPPGKPGEPGPKGGMHDFRAIVTEVLRLVPPPPPAPEVDIKKVAKHAAKYVKPLKGDPGKDADHELVINKIVSMFKEGELKLHVKHLDGLAEGLQQAIEPYRRQLASHGRSGGGDTVAAGTNVTLTQLANGKTQINALGGFTTLAATEVPNGSRTAFTFAAATAQPQFMVVDNVWMKATSAAGNVNWTWNAGTLKATLSVPAVDDIFAIV